MEKDFDSSVIPSSLQNMFVDSEDEDEASMSSKVIHAIVAGDVSVGIRLAHHWATSISKSKEGGSLKPQSAVSSSSVVSDDILEVSHKARVFLQNQKLKHVQKVTKSLELPQSSSVSKSKLTHSEKLKQINSPTITMCDLSRFKLVFALDLSDSNSVGFSDVVQKQLLPNMSMQLLHTLSLPNASSCLFVLSGIKELKLKSPQDRHLLCSSNVIIAHEGNASHAHIPDFMQEIVTHVILPGQQDGGFEHLLMPIRVKMKLRHLDLSSNNIGDEGARYVSKSIHGMRELRHLDLSSNNIGDEGAKYLSQSIGYHMSKLRHLDLSSNNIGDEGAKYLSESIGYHMSKLRHLDLSSNNIGDEGAKYLSQSIDDHRSELRHLDLSSNNIGDEGARFVSKSMDGMRKLKHLDL